MTDLTQYFEYSYEVQSDRVSKAAKILQQVQSWDYVPTPKCIKETFNCSYNTAKEIFESLLERECRTNKGISERVFYYIHTKIVHTRSRFRRFHEEEAVKRLLMSLKTWFPPIRRKL